MKHLAFFSLLCSSAGSQTNIPQYHLYIHSIQQTASAMSCAGNPDLHTPNLDRLAAAGVMFNNAYCTAPLSGPSRGAMFTGHYPPEYSGALLSNGSPDTRLAQDTDIRHLKKMPDMIVLMAGYYAAEGTFFGDLAVRRALPARRQPRSGTHASRRPLISTRACQNPPLRWYRATHFHHG